MLHTCRVEVAGGAVGIHDHLGGGADGTGAAGVRACCILAGSR